MREIKFRAWDKDRKIFVPYGEIIFKNYGENSIEVIPNCMEYIGDKVHNGEPQYSRFEVQQFTGLKDIKGVEIYEGDLISFGDVHWGDDGMPDIKEIVFDEDSASFRIYDYLELQGSSLAEKWFIDDMIDCIEVIGNIHSNPELLKYL